MSLDNVDMYNYSRVIRVYAHCKRTGGLSLDNVDMYDYAKFYQNMPCGSRVISVFAKETDGRTDRPKPICLPNFFEVGGIIN